MPRILFELTAFIFFLLFSPCSRAGEVTHAYVLHNNKDKEVVCFIYHRFGDSRYPSTNTPVGDFADHLAYLKQQKYSVLTFSAAVRYLKDDSPARKVAVITIDDGYESFFKNGLPLLRRYNMPATLFINTKTVGGGDYMGWDHLRECMKYDVEIGNHTHAHDFFLDLSERDRYEIFKKQIEQSQEIIQKNLKVTPETFTYPYGEFDPKMKQIVKDAGFIAAAAQNSGVIYAGGDFFQCPRFPMSESYSAKGKFIEKANMKALRLESVSPESFMIPPGGKPLLRVVFDPDGLDLNQFQCFIQGSKADVKFIDRNKAEVAIQSITSIASRRRTLYTITVKDKEGKWHWYSHLWINPKVKG